MRYVRYLDEVLWSRVMLYELMRAIGSVRFVLHINFWYFYEQQQQQQYKYSGPIIINLTFRFGYKHKNIIMNLNEDDDAGEESENIDDG